MKVSRLEKLIRSILGEKKVHPVIQDTQEALVIMGANIRKFRKNVMVIQLECDKMLTWCSQMEVFVQQREVMLKKHLDKIAIDLEKIVNADAEDNKTDSLTPG